MPDPKPKPSNPWLALLGIPIQMGVTIYGFAWLGRWLAQYFQIAGRWFPLTILMLGIGISFYLLAKQLHDINRKI